MEFDLCIADCKECNGINVEELGEENLFICKDTEKILEKVDDETLKEKICGNPYDDLWVGLKYKIQLSDYCKEIREEDTSPAFSSALCNKCIEKKCRFINICIELYEMNKKDHEGAR